MAYSYGSLGGPAEWAATQQQRRDDQIRNILNLVMQFKQWQNEQGWREKEWQNKLGEQQFGQGQEERRTAAYEKNLASLGEQRGEMPEKVWVAQRLLQVGFDSPEGKALRAAYNIKTTEEELREVAARSRVQSEKPSDYDKKVAAAYKLRAADAITDQVLARVLTGYGEDVTPRQTQAQRRATDYTTERALANFYSTTPKWFKKPEILQSVHMQGLYPEFPKPYNFAQAHIAGGVADESDYDTIKRYEAMRKYFDDNLIGRVKRSDFMNMKLPAWADRDAFLMWYTMAGEK